MLVAGESSIPISEFGVLSPSFRQARQFQNCMEATTSFFAVASQRIDYESLLDEMGVIVPTERKRYIETVYSHCRRIMKEGQLEATRKFSSSFQHE